MSKFVEIITTQTQHAYQKSDLIKLREINMSSLYCYQLIIMIIINQFVLQLNKFSIIE